MRRHTVDGAEILRRTPEMPILAPVVAFEHHLRLDGTGYPFGVQRGVAEPRHDAVQHRGRLRRDAVAARLPAGVPDRPHPRGAEAQRRHAVRSAPGAPLRAAARHLSAGQPGEAQRPARSRSWRACTRPIRIGRACACCSTLEGAGSICRSSGISGSRPAPATEPDSVVAPVDPADYAHRSLELPSGVNGAIMSEASRTLLVAALSLAAGFTWQALRTAAIPVSSPDRLVAELRLAQVAALMLAAAPRPTWGLRRLTNTSPAPASTSHWRWASAWLPRRRSSAIRARR